MGTTREAGLGRVRYEASSAHLYIKINSRELFGRHANFLQVRQPACIFPDAREQGVID